jgi:hypothetical protein
MFTLLTLFAPRLPLDWFENEFAALVLFPVSALSGTTLPDVLGELGEPDVPDVPVDPALGPECPAPHPADKAAKSKTVINWGKRMIPQGKSKELKYFGLKPWLNPWSNEIGLKPSQVERSELGPGLYASGQMLQCRP